jgi:hypothetical protein
MRLLTAVIVFLVGIFATPVASAQPRGRFGDQGELIVGVDRLVPLFSFIDIQQTPIGPPFGPTIPAGTSVTVTQTQTAFSLLWGSTFPQETMFTVPRIGVDYVLVPNVTLGGNLVIYTTLGGHQTTETSTGGASHTDTVGVPSELVFGIAPRGGYILPLSNLFSLWLRGGFSYYTMTTKVTDTGVPPTTTSSNIDQFALDLEPQFVITPVQHFAFTAGINMDIPLAGGHSESIDTMGSPSASAGSSVFYLGLQLGLIGWL